MDTNTNTSWAVWGTNPIDGQYEPLFDGATLTELRALGLYRNLAKDLSSGRLELRRPDGIAVKRTVRPQPRGVTARPLGAWPKAPHAVTDSDGERVGFFQWCYASSRYLFCSDEFLALKPSTLAYIAAEGARLSRRHR